MTCLGGEPLKSDGLNPEPPGSCFTNETDVYGIRFTLDDRSLRWLTFLLRGISRLKSQLMHSDTHTHTHAHTHSSATVTQPLHHVHYTSVLSSL